jgi:hypothetical protein
MKQLMLAAFLLAGNQFEWNRYHDQQAACADAERLARQCERGVDDCDELALRQTQRDCSPLRQNSQEERERP